MRTCIFRSLWIPLFALAFLSLGCTTTPSEDQERAHLLLRLGTSQIEAGDYPKALRSLLEAERLDPRNPVVQNNLGLVYFLRDRVDLAEKHMQNAVKLQSTYSDAKNNLARVYIDRGEPQKAIPLLEQVLKDLTYERPAKATLNLGLAHFRLKEYAVARGYFEKALSYGRDNCLGQTYLGRSYYETADYARAVEILDRAVGFCKASQFDEPHYFSALAYFQLGDRKKAEVRLEEVLKLYTQGRYQQQARTLLDTIRK